MWKPTELLIPLLVYAVPAAGQIIDFETLPGGLPTEDLQPISIEYEAFGVRFSIVDRITGEPIGPAYIAKQGEPCTAFLGCLDEPDTPLSGQGLGDSFLTDRTGGEEDRGNLLVTYLTPVAAASGVVVDVDCADDGYCEQWTITAFDTYGIPLDTFIIDPPEIYNDCYRDPGDAIGVLWWFQRPTNEIASVLISYTGEVDPAIIGLAFDNFSTASVAADLAVIKTGPPGPVSIGDGLTYELVVTNAGPGTANDITLEDVLPPGVSYLSATPEPVFIDEATGLIRWELGEIEPGGTETVQVHAQLDQMMIANNASVSSPLLDPTPADNQHSCTTTVSCEVTTIPDSENRLEEAKLNPNVPNPFNPDTKISFALDKRSDVRIALYDLAGRQVRTLVSGNLDAGTHDVMWDGRDDRDRLVSSGVYFYELQIGGRRLESRKALLMK